METYQLTIYGAEKALQEFLSPRADNAENKTSMYRDISLYGYTYLKDLPATTKGQAVTTTKVYLLGAGLNNDL
jgi:DNA-directed RNA polymerase beta subunit